MRARIKQERLSGHQVGMRVARGGRRVTEFGPIIWVMFAFRLCFVCFSVIAIVDVLSPNCECGFTVAAVV
jgi:hypothetical protein